ncbi:sushi domain containing 4 [Columba livia]|uniref:Sushi domain containing 4 n=1 Tax=Columba livia TaxID=8932 RepID=A0A2I0M518_COLLI|nr:sushi domain-containing protein 4 [Columba livia]PKK24776.1 sushi domain containing 4 [Columba livia]
MDLQHGSKVHSEDEARDRAGDRHDCSIIQTRSGCPGLGNLELLGHGKRVSVRVPGCSGPLKTPVVPSEYQEMPASLFLPQVFTSSSGKVQVDSTGFTARHLDHARLHKEICHARFDDLHTCADPGAPEHGYKTPSAGVFFESVVVRFHCQEGYRLNGTSKKLCVRHFNGSLSWKPSDKPVCLQEVTDCLVPHVEDAEIHNKTYRTGDKLIISCHEGFQIRYPDLDNMVSICQDDGTWDNLPICQGCLRPLVLPHSYINISEFESSFPVGTVVYYQCFPGYKLEGAEFLECMYNLIWSDSPPRCLDVEVCPLPPMVSHGDYICHPRPCERYNHGTVVEFYCDPGYTLTNDYKYITCQYGEWFPSYQVYCVKTEQTWPNTQETLLTTWKIVAFTATSVLLVLLLVILARMFQTKFKTHFLPRGNQEGSMGDPDFVVVDGVPVMLPSYDEAVSSGLNALAPGYSATTDQGHILPTEDQNPPAYPGPQITDTMPSECETCDSRSGSSELLQSLYPSPACQAAVLPGPDRTDVSRSAGGEAASTSPRIDIADEIPLMEEDP